MLAGISRYVRQHHIGLLALFIALGGTAWAAANVNSKDVVNNSLKSIDLKDGKAVKGADVVPDSLGGAAVNESSLGQVPSAASADSATDADTLDGKDSGDFVAPGSEAWQSLPLNDGSAGGSISPGEACFWTAVGGEQTAPAYFRDSAGVVHLKGLVRANDGSFYNCGDVFGHDENITIPQLPSGYRPGNENWVLATISNNKPGRITVGQGSLFIEPGFPAFVDAKVWVSLDGLSFRCAPSGQNGCP